jgi:hypothetical protein
MPRSKTCWNSPRRRTRCSRENCRDVREAPSSEDIPVGVGTADTITDAENCSVRNRQAFTALRPPPFENQTPFLGGHAHEKTVCAPAAAVVGLERAFAFHTCQDPCLLRKDAEKT